MASIAGTRAGRSLGYFQFTVTTAAPVSLPTIPAGAAYAVITLESAGAARWRDDGTAPTTAIGMPLAASASLPYTGANLAALRLIGATVDVGANVTYYDLP